MINTLFFDLNETLLDIRTLQTIFEESFDHPGALHQWLTKTLFMSNTLGIVGEYKGFDALAEEALDQVFMENRRLPSAPIKDRILSQFRQLPPHDDVIPSLEWLKTKGLRCVVISNSTQEMMQEQLKHAGLTDYFDNTYSVGISFTDSAIFNSVNVLSPLRDFMANSSLSLKLSNIFSRFSFKQQI